MMDKTKCKEIRNILNETLENAIPNCKVKIGNMSYNTSSCSVKIEVAEINDDGVVETREHKDYLLYGKAYGLEKSWLNKIVDFGGCSYKIVGYKPRSSKYPVLAEMNGKTYKFSVSKIKAIYENSV